jgi:hypothetical protein
MTISIWLFATVLAAPGAPSAHPQAPSVAGEAAQQSIRFAGSDWNVKTSRGNVGPGPNIFGREGVRVDRLGHLHLAIARQDGRWICSEVVSKRNFGYGEYRFVVRETANLDVNAVLGLFLWDTSAPEHQYREVDIELSRWGDGGKPNAQFVVQPYTRPANLDRFELPAGRAVVSFRWSPGRLFCRALVNGRIVHEHLFTHGVPEPGHENVRLNLWLFRAAPPANGKPVEVELEGFKYLPLTRSIGKGR